MKLTPAQEAWLKDLETTDAPQTTGALENPQRNVLNRPPGFCCLGRACVVAEQHGIKVDRIQREPDSPLLLNGGSLASQPAVLEWIKLRSDAGVPIWDSSRLPTLIDMNDTGKSFKEIAAAIRKAPEAYFFRPEEYE